MVRKKRVSATFDPISEDIVIEPPEPMGLEVKDLDSIEIIDQDTSLEVRHSKSGDTRYKSLIFPRELLVKKFVEPGKNLSLPDVMRSEWFRRQLKQYGFTDESLFIRDELGKFLCAMPESLDYEVRQKI